MITEWCTRLTKWGKQRKERGKAHYLQYLINEEEKRLVFAVGGRSVHWLRVLEFLVSNMILIGWSEWLWILSNNLVQTLSIELRMSEGKLKSAIILLALFSTLKSLETRHLGKLQKEGMAYNKHERMRATYTLKIKEGSQPARRRFLMM